MKIISVFILIFATACAGNHHSKHKNHHKGHKVSHSWHAHHHRFDDAEKWAKVFEKEERKKWQKPNQVIRALNLKKTAKVADIGAGTGYFPVRIAKKRPAGRVYAIDIEPNLIRYLYKRKYKEGLKNLFPVLGSMDDPLIPEKVDVIMMVDTYHHISKRAQYFSHLKTYLKKNGRIVIVDFKKGKLPVGPKDKMKIAPQQVIKEMKEAGFELHKMESFLPYQYMITFK